MNKEISTIRKKTFTLQDAYRIAGIDPIRTSPSVKLRLNELFDHYLTFYRVTEDYGDLDLVKDLEAIGEKGKKHTSTYAVPS